MMSYILGGAALALVLYLFNKGAFRKLFAAGRAQVGEIGRKVESADPQALMNQAIEDDAAKIREGREAITNIDAILMQVNDQVATLTTEKARLENRIIAVERDGDPEGTLVGYAEQLVGVEEQLAANIAQQQTLTGQYDVARQKIRAAESRITKAKSEAKTMGAQLKVSSAVAAAVTSAESLNFDAAEGTYARAKQLMQEKIYGNEARSKNASVGNEQAAAEARDAEREKKIAAEAIIARVKAARNGQGSAPAPAPATPAVAKEPAPTA